MPTRKTTKKAKPAKISTSRKITVASAGASQEISYDTKTIITLLLLLFFYPLGLIFMWGWMQWKTWLKLLVTLPLILTVLFMFTMIMLIGKTVRNERDMRMMQYNQMKQVQTLTPTPMMHSYQ